MRQPVHTEPDPERIQLSGDRSHVRSRSRELHAEKSRSSTGECHGRSQQAGRVEQHQLFAVERVERHEQPVEHSAQSDGRRGLCALQLGTRVPERDDAPGERRTRASACGTHSLLERIAWCHDRVSDGVRWIQCGADCRRSAASRGDQRGKCRGERSACGRLGEQTARAGRGIRLFAQISGAGRNALFNPFNQAIAAEADPVKLAVLKNALNLALVNANRRAQRRAAAVAGCPRRRFECRRRRGVCRRGDALRIDRWLAEDRDAARSTWTIRWHGTMRPNRRWRGRPRRAAFEVRRASRLPEEGVRHGRTARSEERPVVLSGGHRRDRPYPALQVVVQGRWLLARRPGIFAAAGARAEKANRRARRVAYAAGRGIAAALAGRKPVSEHRQRAGHPHQVEWDAHRIGAGFELRQHQRHQRRARYGRAGVWRRWRRPGWGGGYGGSGSVVIGVAGGTANSNSIASQDSSRDVSEFFADKLRQSIMQNAESYRQLNASVVTTVQEGQRYGVTSEVVANHNHCHALTMMYFEVLRHYAIFQELSSVEECVFVPLLMTNFTTENIYKWRDVLASFLLPMPSDTYLQSLPYAAGTPRSHPLVRAFDANERIKTKYANVDFPEGAYDDEPIQFVRGSMRLTVNLPRPRTRYDRVLSFPLTKQVDLKAMAGDTLQFSQDMVAYSAKVAATGGIFALFEKAPNAPNPAQYEIIAREAIFDAFMSLDANYGSVAPADCIRIRNFKPPAVIALPGFPPLGTQITDPAAFFADNKDDQDQWKIYADLLGYQDVLTMLNAYFAGNLISEWDTIFYNDIAPLVFERIISSIGISELSIDFSTEVKYKGGERQVQLNLSGTTSRKRNQLPLQLRLEVSRFESQGSAEIRDPRR